jgi:deoxyadenosine/deoxycytidine kinase
VALALQRSLTLCALEPAAGAAARAAADRGAPADPRGAESTPASARTKGPAASAAVPAARWRTRCTRARRLGSLDSYASRRDDIILLAVRFRHIAVEGPIGAGKTALAERLGTRLDATIVLEESENPFLADFYADRPGAALQAQLFYLLNRHRQQTALRQADLFSQITICDYVFDKDKIFAYLNLDDNELFIYQRLYDLLAREIPPPDLVIYLQAPTDVLLRRIRARRSDPQAALFDPDPEYVKELNEAYHHFFFHYNLTPLLVVETSQFDSEASDDAFDDLVRQIRTMPGGTRYYVPRTK